MWNDFRTVMILSYRTLVQRGSSLAVRTGRWIVSLRPRTEEEYRSDARDRFWAAVRDGREEAEERSAKTPRPVPVVEEPIENE